MNTNLEIEFKTLLTPYQFTQLSMSFSNVPIITQINHYYQYSDDSMPIAARIRQIDQHFELTFKIKQVKGRLEVNFDVSSNDILMFSREDVQSFLFSNGYTQKFKYLGALTTYRRLIIEDDGELCIDENHFLGEVDYEIEYEVTHDEERAFARFNDLVTVYHLSNEKAKTKYHRFLLRLAHHDVDGI